MDEVTTPNTHLTTNKRENESLFIFASIKGVLLINPRVNDR